MSKSEKKTIPNNINCDACPSKVVLAISSTLYFMQTFIFILLEELAFYLILLEKMGAKNEKIQKDFIEVFFSLTVNFEYTIETFDKIIQMLYEELIQAKELYKKLCNDFGTCPQRYKSIIKISGVLTPSKAIRKGEEHFKKTDEMLSNNEKRFFDIFIIVLKSICLYLVELQDLEINIEEYYKKFLNAFTSVQIGKMSEQEMEEEIKKQIQFDYELMQKVFETRKNVFGELVPTDILFSTKEGKAILVAGSSIKELELILKATKDKNINIYTHGQMISGHLIPEIKKYPNLVGQYGKGFENFYSDFEYFPSAVFLTKLSSAKMANFYSGGIFTRDLIAPQGVNLIKEDNFEPLIQYALKAKGFGKTEEEKKMSLGFFEDEIIQKFYNIAQKVLEGKIKKLFLIGVTNDGCYQKKYFEEFLNLLDEDSFVISFSPLKAQDNVLFLNIDYGFPFLYKFLEILSSQKKLSELDITIFFTRYEPHTLPNLIYVRQLGIKNIYIDKCYAPLVNPAILDFVKNKYDIRIFTNPQSDFENIKKN